MKNSWFMFKHFKLLFICFISNAISGQSDTINQHISAFIYLDSLTVVAKRQGFDVEDFIKLVREDESFYEAFRNLRFVSYYSDNDIKMYDKKRREKASYQSKVNQIAEGNCRTMSFMNESVEGNFFKRKKKHRYYTAKMFDQLFFTHKKICESRKEAAPTGNEKGMEKHIIELKKLIFKPGEKANVPLIGDKTAIFEEKMLQYYDFSIASKRYENSHDCYVFTAKIKDEFQIKKEGKTVIKFLETYFEKGTFQVIARNYKLAYKTAVYDFDVEMKVKLKQLKNQYLPELIEYDGNWDVPARKPEISKFSIKFYDFY